MPQAVTANRLSDGEVVYLAPDGSWSEGLEDCRTADGKAEVEAMMEVAARAEKARVVVAPYPFDVVLDGGTVRPARLREAIRARGPTVRRDLGKQALRENGADVSV